VIKVQATRTAKGIEPRSEEAQKIADFKASLPEGTRVEITFAKWDATRSDQANRFFHAINGKYARANGVLAEKCKIDLKYAHGVWVLAEEAMKDPPAWNGRFVEYHTECVFFKTTAEYTVKEFSTLIEGAISECYDSQIDISDVVREYRG
jgi:hypothetical protein